MRENGVMSFAENGSPRDTNEDELFSKAPADARSRNSQHEQNTMLMPLFQR